LGLTIIVYPVIRIFMKQQARFFKALADETRLQILWLLMGQDELCVCDIMTVLGITQSKASRHLRYLFNLGWVTDRREGLWMYYRLALPGGEPGEHLLQLLAGMLAAQPGARALREKLTERLRAKRQCCPDPEVLIASGEESQVETSA
jgi:ArsR family transcriptional regulator, arsenate/arsenite/antimonite-responsive transcriptional repressor